MKHLLHTVLVCTLLCTFFSVNAQNIALAKNVVASSFENTGTEPSKLNDSHGTGAEINAGTGSCVSGFCTRWSSNPNDAEWVYIDLAAAYNLTQVTLYWEAANGKDFTIDVSNDAMTWTTAATITNNTSYVNTINITGFTGRYVRMNGTARNTAFGYSLWEFEINGTIVSALGSNLALNKPAVGSSELLPATNATDGSGNGAGINYLGGCSGCTFWASNYNNDPEWIYVDLGTSTNLRQVILYWEFFSAANFDIQVSPDALAWTTVKTYTGNTAYANTFDVTGATGRYVRILGTARTTSQNYQLFEIEIYGNTTLPVTITDFAATKQNTSAKISWSTGQEINSREFIVQRSINGTTWTDLARVAAQGNSTGTVNYTITDPNPAKGNNYYRLKVVDVDNKFDFSATRRVNFASKYTYSIYPNPVTDNVLQLTGDNTGGIKADIQVLNAQSQVVMSQKLNSNTQPAKINVASLATGVYYLRIVASDGTVNTEKFIKR